MSIILEIVKHMETDAYIVALGMSSSAVKKCATQIMPEFTAGGRREAEIATPTRLAIWSSNSETATPRPEMNATGRAMTRFCHVHRLTISDVGHASTIQEMFPEMPPTMMPTTMQKRRQMISLRSDRRTNLQSQMVLPYANPTTVVTGKRED